MDNLPLCRYSADQLLHYLNKYLMSCFLSRRQVQDEAGKPAKIDDKLPLGAGDQCLTLMQCCQELSSRVIRNQEENNFSSPLNRVAPFSFSIIISSTSKKKTLPLSHYKQNITEWKTSHDWQAIELYNNDTSCFSSGRVISKVKSLNKIIKKNNYKEVWPRFWNPCPPRQAFLPGWTGSFS